MKLNKDPVSATKSICFGHFGQFMIQPTDVLGLFLLLFNNDSKRLTKK